ncbi:MAG: cytochrome c biogenesis protein ResB [Thermodesulfobacteriota bacterium]
MSKEENAVWRFFASVKLALFVLFILAATSIIGTLIPQNNPPDFYFQEFGPNLARLFLILDFHRMYNSWWFLILLMLFSMNLIICTLDRLPNVWRMVMLDNLATPPERLEKMELRRPFAASVPPATAADALHGILQAAGWKAKTATLPEGTLLFAQKGAWSRLGVYGVHLSILIIFAGAIIGSLFGFKAGVMIPEGHTISEVYEFGTNRSIPLGFDLRCDRFEIKFYANGMPKEYRSDLVVIDPQRSEPLAKAIVVNDPLDYRGITFYQSSYEPTNEFLIQIDNPATSEKKLFRIPAGQQVAWPGTDISFGIINMMQNERGGDSRFKIWFSDGKGEPAVFWMPDSVSATIPRDGQEYLFSLKQMYATGLQVAKDPGVWVVYIGCGLMLIGLYVAFFLSHQRLWVYIQPEGGTSRVLLCGTSNKNRLGFERNFAAVAEKITQNPSFTETEVAS